ncbi:MAG: CAAD domain-containing protein, partial [Cyanobacteriota bacterium]
AMSESPTTPEPTQGADASPAGLPTTELPTPELPTPELPPPELPIAEQPGTEQPGAEQTGAEQTGDEQPAAQQPAAAAAEPVQVAEPVPVAEPMPVPEPQLPSGVAATLTVPPIAVSASAEPPSADGTGGEGGEWELLSGKVRQWLADLQLGELWQRYRGGLRLLLWLVLLLVALRTYAAVVGTIDSIPVVSGLLELVGLVVAGRFAVRRLLPSQERARTVADLQGRWRAFRGQD